MKIKAKLLSILLTAVLLSAIFAFPASASYVYGECGYEAYWMYDTDIHTLYIYGDGEMNWYDALDYPWHTKAHLINKIVISEGITAIPDGAFSDMYALTTVEITSELRSVGSHAFANCSSLEEIYLPGTVSYPGEGVFAGCTNLKRVVLGDGFDYISASMFYDCHSLREIVYPNTISGMGTDAYVGCDSLESAFFPADASGGVEAYFSHCNSLKTIYFYSHAKTVSFLYGERDSLVGNTKVRNIGLCLEYADMYPCLDKSGVPMVEYGGYQYYLFSIDDMNEKVNHTNRYEVDEYTHIAVCESCGMAGLSEDHNYTECVIIVEPTTQSFGIMEWRCVCGASRQEEIAMLVPDADNSTWFEEGEGNHIIIKPADPDYEGGMTFEPESAAPTGVLIVIIAVAVIAVVCLGGLALIAAVIVVVIIIVKKKKK